MTRVNSALAVMLAIVLAASAVPAQKLPEIKVEKYELANGLDVILHEDHTLPTVTVNIWYHVGSKNEKIGRTGFAHLFEHLMFEGSEHNPEDYTKWLESVGGDNNASTSEDRTNYFDSFPSNHLERVLWLEADRMGYLPPAITQEKLDIQRDVVKNERRQRMDNQPYAKAYELSLEALYPKEHPYSWPVIGSMEDLARASLDDVKEFFETYYSPNNASLVIAGDFNPAQAKELVEKYFGTLPPGPPVDRMKHWIPELDGVKRITAEDRVSLPRLFMIWPSPPMYQPGDAEFDLLANILTSGKTSRLYQALVYEQQIAQDVSAYQGSNELSSSFNIEVTAKPGHTLDEVEKAVDAILRDVIEKGITAGELKNAQTVYEANFVRAIQRINWPGGRADQLNAYNVMLGDPNKFQWDLDRYLTATPAAIQRFAQEYLPLDERVIIHITPFADYKAGDLAVDRAKAPASAAEPTFTPPMVQRAKLSNGMDLLLVEKRDFPIVQTNLVIKNGWAADPADKPGSASLTSDLLDEGTKSRSALEISEEAKALGANLGTSSSFDGTSISLNVLKKNLDKGYALMSDVVLNPSFPQEELDRIRKSYMGRIAQESRVPTTSAFKTFFRLLYGPGHPYAQPHTGTGTPESIQAITRDDLVNYYKANYLPNNAAAVVVGDISLAEAKDKLEKAFKNWKPGDVKTHDIPAPAKLTATKIYIVDKPAAPQSVIVVGNVGMKRNDPAYSAMEVMNTAFGGQFTSRLNNNLREEKGYTYGAGAQSVGRRGEGPYFAYAEVQTEVTGPALTEFVKEMKAIGADRPLTTEELLASQGNLVKGYSHNFETYSSIASQLGTIALYDLPTDEWQTYMNRVSGIDVKAATQVAKDFIHPDALLVVVVGDRSKIEPELKKLNLGDVEVLDPATLSAK